MRQRVSPQGCDLERACGAFSKGLDRGVPFFGQVVLTKVPLFFVLGSLCNLQIGIYKGSIEFFCGIIGIIVVC